MSDMVWRESDQMWLVDGKSIVEWAVLGTKAAAMEAENARLREALIHLREAAKQVLRADFVYECQECAVGRTVAFAELKRLVDEGLRDAPQTGKSQPLESDGLPSDRACTPPNPAQASVLPQAEDLPPHKHLWSGTGPKAYCIGCFAVLCNCPTYANHHLPGCPMLMKGTL